METRRTQLSFSEVPEKVEKSTPQARAEPWAVLRAKRKLIRAGNTIHAPEQDAC